MTPIEPHLAPPGAGLPKFELVVARMLFALRRRTASRRALEASFQKEREVIRSLIHSCDEESGARRVLIRRVRGLEDSSRYWSVWMTLDHLRIVHGGFVRAIQSLLKGVVPDGAASTAAVKPSPEASMEVIAAYEASCDAVLAAAGDASDLRTSARYAHPWFGPLDAASWYALAPTHLAIHRVQIERILGALETGRS